MRAAIVRGGGLKRGRRPGLGRWGGADVHFRNPLQLTSTVYVMGNGKTFHF